MYTLLVRDDKCIRTTKKERIFQNTLIRGNVRFLINKDYNGHDMSECRVTLLYELPLSHEFGVAFLEPSEELYKEEYYEYIIPSDTLITIEHGDVVVDLIISAEIDEKEQIVEFVTDGKIHIDEYTRIWENSLSDEDMSTIDKTLLDIQAIKRRQEEILQEIKDLGFADDLVINRENGKLYLTINGETVGDGADVVIPQINDGELDGESNGIIELDKM